MAKNNIPTSFTIGGRLWKVVYKDNINEGRILGKWLDNRAEIHIAKNIKEDGEWVECCDYVLENTFWHEFGHVLQYYGIGENNEAFAQAFATFIMEFNKTKK